MENQPNPQEARAALDAVAQSRADMADRLITPWWYHPVLGVLVGGFLATAFSGLPFSVLIGALVAYCAGLAGLVYAYRRKTGVWIGGTDAGPRARRSLVRWTVSLLVLVLVTTVFSVGMELRWIAPVAGLAAAVTTAVWGPRYDELLRAELRESA